MKGYGMFDSFWLFVHHHGSMLPIMLLGYILLARIWGIWVESWMRTRIVGAAAAPPKAASLHRFLLVSNSTDGSL
jgi:hypothetical protein